MPMDSPHDIRVYNNGKKEMIKNFSLELIHIIFKNVDDKNIRINIFNDFIKEFPEINNHIDKVMYY